MVVNCPPWYDAAHKRTLSKFITNNLDNFARKHPGTGMFVVGDFNTLNTGFLTRQHGLIQVVKGYT